MGIEPLIKNIEKDISIPRLKLGDSKIPKILRWLYLQVRNLKMGWKPDNRCPPRGIFPRAVRGNFGLILENIRSTFSVKAIGINQRVFIGRKLSDLHLRIFGDGPLGKWSSGTKSRRTLEDKGIITEGKDRQVTVVIIFFF